MRIVPELPKSEKEITNTIREMLAVHVTNRSCPWRSAWAGDQDRQPGLHGLGLALGRAARRDGRRPRGSILGAIGRKIFTAPEAPSKGKKRKAEDDEDDDRPRATKSKDKAAKSA